MVWGVGVDHKTFITPIPTFPPQGGRRLRVMDPIATGTSPQGEGFPPSPKGTLNPSFPPLPSGRQALKREVEPTLREDSLRELPLSGKKG